MRLALRGRFALLAATLVIVVASLVGLAGYVTFRASVLGHAAATARSEAHRLVGLVAAGGGGDGQIVDLTDPSLTRQLPAPGVRVEVDRPTGRQVQATPSIWPHALPIAARVRAACLAAGNAQTRLVHPQLAVACARVGPARAPVATIAVGVALQDSLASLAALRRALAVGIVGGGLLAALLSLLLARRALAPLKRISMTAQTIRAGDLSRRIGYRGRDEVGQLADVLDACFAELQEAIDRQRRFAAEASHELRTPLAAIRANVEVLQGWASADPEARRVAIDSLDQSARRASRLVADLLTLVRLEREPERPRAPVRLDAVVIGAVREAAPLRTGIAIRVERLDEVVLAEGDHDGLQQVLVNVLDNALRMSPPASEIRVALTRSGDLASVRVSDSGPGIADDARERIFDRFYTRRTGTDGEAGAGLGLAIARAIARAHGGDLVAERRPGPGATLTLSLPVATDAGHGAPASSVQEKFRPAPAS
jgi:signal transduction histidine kinase